MATLDEYLKEGLGYDRLQELNVSDLWHGYVQELEKLIIIVRTQYDTALTKENYDSVKFRIQGIRMAINHLADLIEKHQE